MQRRYLKVQRKRLAIKHWQTSRGRLHSIAGSPVCERKSEGGDAKKRGWWSIHLYVSNGQSPAFLRVRLYVRLMSHIGMRHVTLMNEREETRAIVYSIVYSHINELFNCLFRIVVCYVYIYAHTSEETYIYEKRPIKIDSWLLSIHV